MKKPTIIEKFADNGEHSHWTLCETQTGKYLWSEFPEEELSVNQKDLKSQLKPQEGEREKGSLSANTVTQLLEALIKSHYGCKKEQKKEAARVYLSVINAIKRGVI